jgi:hypothetical protein
MLCAKYRKNQCRHKLVARRTHGPKTQRGAEDRDQTDLDDADVRASSGENDEHESSDDVKGEQQGLEHGKWYLVSPKNRRHGHSLLNLNNFFISREFLELQRQPFQLFCDSFVSRIRDAPNLDSAARALVMEGLQRLLSVATASKALDSS